MEAETDRQEAAVSGSKVISEDEFRGLVNRMEEFFGVDAVQEFFSIQWEEE